MHSVTLLSGVKLAKTFSHSVSCSSFSLLRRAFYRHETRLSIVGTISRVTGVLLSKAVLAYAGVLKCLLSSFSFINFRVSAHTVRSLLCLESIRVRDRGLVSFCSMQIDIHVSQLYLLKRLSFFQCVLLVSLLKIMQL